MSCCFPAKAILIQRLPRAVSCMPRTPAWQSAAAYGSIANKARWIAESGSVEMLNWPLCRLTKTNIVVVIGMRLLVPLSWPERFIPGAGPVG